MDEDGCKENLVDLTNTDDPGSPVEPEAKKLKVEVVDCVELMDEDNLNGSVSSSGRKAPRTPKVSKEERESERLRKLEMKRQREEERDKEREKARLEKERLAEEKRLEREKKEKEREEKKREEERRKEEKRKAEEERAEKRKKEEEEKQKKKEELALRKKEEDERKESKRREEEERKQMKRKEEVAEEVKMKRASARFIGFFNKVEKPSQSACEEDCDLWYKPFQVKPGMKLAPILRRDVVPAEDYILDQHEDIDRNTYFNSIKSIKKTGPRKLELRAKLFQFHDNYRPPYYGTWRKVDKKVSPKRPWLPGSTEIDYDVDSDAEWEDEPSDAEECRSDEEDPETDEADSDQGDFFVEPGYLSDGEGADEESDERLEAENPEARAARLAARANEWKQRVLKKDKVLVPVILAAGGLPAGMRQHPMSNVRKLNELVHECQVQLALFRHATQGIGTTQDGASLRREVETAGRACLKACEAAKNCVLPQLRHEGVEFTRHASQFIGCVAAYVVEMKRCVALERTFPAPTEPSITPPQIANMESMLENLENLITVHFSTSESSPTDKVTPRRRRATSCRPQCMCSNLKTSYA